MHYIIYRDGASVLTQTCLIKGDALCPPSLILQPHFLESRGALHMEDSGYGRIPFTPLIAEHNTQVSLSNSIQ